jgi:uncharacterized protein YraI
VAVEKSKSMINSNERTVLLLLATLVACGGEGLAKSESMNSSADDGIATSEAALSTDIKFGTQLQTTTELNLRTGPSTSYAVKLVMPSGALSRAVRTSPSNGWYEINYQGHVGWSSGTYLKVDQVPSGARDEAVARGISVWGFSYRWGGGAWDPTSQSPGACYGSCPDCTHSGTWGADCSGFVAKVWVVPPSNAPLTLASHPYNTSSFRNGSNYWSTVTRSNALRADALVYHTNGAGHIFLFTGGDPWNSMQAIECRGCTDGCVYNTRTASSAYIAIRRDGY